MRDPRKRRNTLRTYRKLDLDTGWQMVNKKPQVQPYRRVGACARARLGPRDAVGEPWVGGGLGGRHVPEGGWGR